MEREQVGGSYLISLLWISVTLASTLCTTVVTHILFVDFVHGNPNRTQGNAITMMGIFPPIFSIIAIVGCFIVFGPPQLVQAILHRSFVKRHQSMSALFVLGFVPFTAILTCYCWDYLTPTDFNFGFNEGPDWQSYQHGITAQRYLAALAYQLPVTLFSLLYFNPKIVRMSRRSLVIALIAIGAVIGIGLGYYTATEQYQFIDHRQGGIAPAHS